MLACSPNHACLRRDRSWLAIRRGGEPGVGSDATGQPYDGEGVTRPAGSSSPRAIHAWTKTGGSGPRSIRRRPSTPAWHRRRSLDRRSVGLGGGDVCAAHERV